MKSQNFMDDTEKPRSIRLPEWLWGEIDREAKNCKRSAVKQMEVVLTAYYRGEDAGINSARLDQISPIRAETQIGDFGGKPGLNQIDISQLKIIPPETEIPKGNAELTDLKRRQVDDVGETGKRKAAEDEKTG